MQLSFTHFIAINLICWPIFAMVACSEKAAVDVRTNLSQEYIYEDEASRDQAIKSAEISCQLDSQGCPEYVGGLVRSHMVMDWQVEKSKSIRKYGATVCSLTLISADEALTNRHCIPTDLQAENVNCSDRIQAIFPKTATKPAEKVDCAKIVALADDYVGLNGAGSAKDVNNPDWAVIRFKTPVNRTPVKVKASPIANHTPIKIFPVFWQIDMATGKFAGKVREVGCRSSMSSVLLPHYFSQDSFGLTVVDCSSPLILGNSGSGYLNDKGELVGVLNSVLRENNKITIKDKEYSIDNRSSAGVKAACMSYFNPKKSPHCRYTYGSFNEKSSQFVLQQNIRFFENSQSQKVAAGITEADYPGVEFSPTNRPAFIADLKIPQFAERSLSKLPPELQYYGQRLEEILAQAFPKTPNCINAPTEEVELPRLESDLWHLARLEAGEVLYPIRVRPMSFAVTYDQGKAKLNLQTLPDRSAARKLTARWQDYHSSLIVCLATLFSQEAKVSRENCKNTDELQKKYEEYLSEQRIAEDLASNEIYLLNLDEDELSFELPICN